MAATYAIGTIPMIKISFQPLKMLWEGVQNPEHFTNVIYGRPLRHHKLNGNPNLLQVTLFFCILAQPPYYLVTSESTMLLCGIWLCPLVHQGSNRQNLHLGIWGNPQLIYTWNIQYVICPNTEWMECIFHRKRKETKQQPGTAGPGSILGCCLVSVCFLGILHSVLYIFIQPKTSHFRGL